MTERIGFWERIRKFCDLKHSNSGQNVESTNVQPVIDAATAKEIDRKFGYLSEQNRTTIDPTRIS